MSIEEIDRLLPVLNSSKIQKDNPSLYQVVKALLDNLKDALKSLSSLNSSGLSSSGIILSKQIILTNAQIESLPTTRILVLNTPTPGFRIKVIAASISINSLASAYTNLNAVYADLHLEWGTTSKWATNAIYRDSTTTPVITGLSTLLEAGANVISDFIPPYFEVWGDIYWPFSNSVLVGDTDGLALNLSIDNNGSGNLVGDPANTGKVTIYYVIEKL